MKWIITCSMIIFFSCTQNKNLKDFRGTYLESVLKNYEAGLLALKDEDFDRAISYFQFVKNKYPFSKFAALSDLKIADVKFLQKNWLEAASLYEIFLRLHPRHEESAYAYFRVALSFFNAIPSHSFFFPDPASLDQSHTKEALMAFDRFIEQFPNSSFITEALDKKNLLLEQLAKHDLFVANYYFGRKRYKSAKARYEKIIEDYRDTKAAIKAKTKLEKLSSL